MESKVTDSREFIRSAIGQQNKVYVLTKVKALIEKGIAHTSVIGIDKGLWCDAANTAWDSTAIAVAKLPSEKLVFISEDGDVCAYGGGNSTKEKIVPFPKMIRNAISIEGHVVACGMLRQVFERVDEGKWLDISAPFPGASEKVGFEAIDGYSLKELYAVGWKGEIWQYDGSIWTNRSGPTNLILSSICCVQDGVVYIGGQEGVLIQGRNDSWEIIEWEEETDIDIWDLCWFEGKLYVASMTDLFTFDKDRLVVVDFGELEIPTCYSLTEAEGIMWSVGKDDVLSFDGKRWQRYE